MKEKLLSQKFRNYAYGVIAAVAPLLVLLGVLGPDEVSAVLAVAGAVLGAAGSVTAAAFSSKKYETSRKSDLEG